MRIKRALRWHVEAVAWTRRARLGGERSRTSAQRISQGGRRSRPHQPVSIGILVVDTARGFGLPVLTEHLPGWQQQREEAERSNPMFHDASTSNCLRTTKTRLWHRKPSSPWHPWKLPCASGCCCSGGDHPPALIASVVGYPSTVTVLLIFPSSLSRMWRVDFLDEP